MNDLANIANVAEIIGAIIVVGGLIFAVLQMRQTRQQRREMAAIELFRFFGHPKFTAAYKRVLRLPEGISADDIQGNGSSLEESAMHGTPSHRQPIVRRPDARWATGRRPPSPSIPDRADYRFPADEGRYATQSAKEPET